jgi:hypothetical protein
LAWGDYPEVTGFSFGANYGSNEIVKPLQIRVNTEKKRRFIALLCLPSQMKISGVQQRERKWQISTHLPLLERPES